MALLVGLLGDSGTVPRSLGPLLALLGRVLGPIVPSYAPRKPLLPPLGVSWLRHQALLAPP